MTGHGKGTPKTSLFGKKLYCESKLTAKAVCKSLFFKAQQQVFL